MKIVSSPVKQSGATLIVSLMLLIIVTMLGLSTMRTATMEERMARFSREQVIAFQAAEAALVDAQLDISSPNGLRAIRVHDSAFQANCTLEAGFCAPASAGNTPIWRQAATLGVEYQTFGRTGLNAALPGLPVGTGANNVAQRPRYITEFFRRVLPGGSAIRPDAVYRITAVGFGPSIETQSWVQMTYLP